MSAWEDGSPDATIAIVGEAPAAYEIRANKPFVGPAGHVLEEALHSAGIVRRGCYITNVFQDLVRKSKDGDVFISGETGNVLWSDKHGFTEEGQEHLDALRMRLNACGANVIVPLGSTALEALYGERSIMKWRGSILPSIGLDKVRKLVPSVHPAAILRGQPLWKYLLVHDMKRVKEEEGSPLLSPTEREILIEPTFTEAVAFLKEAKAASRIATDIEVYNHQVSCFSIALNPNLVMSIPLLAENYDYFMESDEVEIWRLYAEILGDTKIQKINQNISFDIWFLYHQMGIFTKGELGDTMVAQHILYPDFPKGLDFICSIHTREPYYKDDGKLWSRPQRDLKRFWQYNAKDAAVAMEAWDKLYKELVEGEYLENYHFTMNMVEPLVFMQTKGILVDQEKLNATKKEVSNLIEQKMEELNRMAKKPFNPGSPKQCQEYFYGTLGLKPYLNNKTGRPSTDDLALARIIRRDRIPEARLVQEIRTLNKLSDSYLSVQLDRDGRIRCSYNIRGTVTGRLSSSKTIFGTGMNMQNIDPRFRSFMVADDA